jgi:Cu+-exporting ATPase
MVAMGRATEKGFLIKSGDALEQGHKLSTLVFDKTGTLTKGEPHITDIIAVGGFDTQTILSLASGIARHSDHPLSLAILEGARQRGIEPLDVSQTQTLAGKGLVAEHRNLELVLGNQGLMKEQNISTSLLQDASLRLIEEGKSIVYLAQDRKLQGILGIQDTLRESTPSGIKRLQKMKIRLLMLTGDNERTAQIIAQKAGIQDMVAHALPETKAQTIQNLKNKFEIVGMIGDGINDAPALALADVSFAMGKGEEIAIENASVVLVRQDINSVADMIQLSKKTMKIIKQNLFFSFIYNLAAIPLAAGLLSHWGITLNPALAALAMGLSSVSVVGNSLRLRKA